MEGSDVWALVFLDSSRPGFLTPLTEQEARTSSPVVWTANRKEGYEPI